MSVFVFIESARPRTNTITKSASDSAAPPPSFLENSGTPGKRDEEAHDPATGYQATARS